MIGVAVLVAGCTGQVTAPAPHSKPLLFEVRNSGESFALFLNDTPAPTDRETWARILGRHANLVDADAGFAGFDANGHSVNQVVFRCPPDAPSGMFFQVVEHLVAARIVKVRVGLSRPGQDALHCELELPRDESLGPNRDNRLIFEGSRDAQKLNWKVRVAPGGKAILVATGQPATPEDWADQPFGERHASLLQVAEKVTRGFDFYDAAVTWKPSAEPPAWGPVFEALAAIAELNTARRSANATLISTSVYEFSEPAGPEGPPSDPNAFPAPAPEDLAD